MSKLFGEENKKATQGELSIPCKRDIYNKPQNTGTGTNASLFVLPGAAAIRDVWTARPANR